MRIETRNFCWGMDPDDVEEGFVIPFCPGVQQGMDGVIIETKCVPESAFYLGLPPKKAAWLELQFSFYTPKHEPLLVEDLGLIFNYEWFEVEWLQAQFNDFEKKKKLHYGDGVEPYGHLEAYLEDDTVRVEFHFDANYYLGPESIFGGDFWFFVDSRAKSFLVL